MRNAILFVKILDFPNVLFQKLLFGAGAGRSRALWVEPEPEPDPLFLPGAGAKEKWFGSTTLV